MKMKMTPLCLPRQAGSKRAICEIKRSISNSDLRSAQDQVMTQVGQSAYLPKRLDEPSLLALFARLCLHPVASYWRKTDCGHMWPQMTFPWPQITSCTRIITDGVIGLDPERLGWFRLVYARLETFSYFPIGWLIVERPLNWFDIGSPGLRFRDTQFICTNGLMLSYWQ